MSSLLKRSAGNALVQYLQDNLPSGLGISVDVAAADWEEPTKFPSVRVIPQKFSFIPWQENEVDSGKPDILVSEVGTFEGVVELRVSASSRPQREVVEDAVSNLFLTREHSPGILVTQTKPVTVGGLLTAYPALATFALSDEDWREEFVFQKKRYSFLELDAWYPALISKQVYTINELILAFGEDLSSDSYTEAHIVNDDGTLTPTT